MTRPATERSQSVCSFVFLGILLAAFMGCKSTDDSTEELVGNWKKFSDFEGVPRSSAVAFVIGNKAYVGTGYDGKNRLNDFWEYDPDVNNWTRKADFPGAPRNGAVGFATSTKGYIGTGFDGTNRLKDFYEYDPTTNTWLQVADFGGTARHGAVAFAIGDNGYVGTGDDGSFLKDIWEYEPAMNLWTQKVSLGGAKRRNAVAFVIGGKAYICTGVNNGVYEYDLWEYDPLADQWNKKRPIANASDEDYDDDYSGIEGTNKVAFSLSGRGFIATGGYGGAGGSVWEYNPSSDLWKQKTSLEAPGRMEAVGFLLGNTGYIATGRNLSYYFDDVWGFEPDIGQVDLDKTGGIISP